MGSSKHSTTVLFWSILCHRGRGPPETEHSDLMYGIFVNKITPALLPVVNFLCFTSVTVIKSLQRKTSAVTTCSESFMVPFPLDSFI